MNKRYATMPRLPYETDWGQSRHYDWEDRQMVEEAIAEVAGKAGLRLVSRTPEAGWESCSHNPHGRYVPCGQMTQGARSVWVWVGR